MTVDSLREWILVGGGAVAVSGGAYLPWLKTNPSLPPDAVIPMIGFPGMNAGFQGHDFALLGLVGLVLTLRAVSSRKRLQSVFTLLTGVGTVAFCAYYLSSFSHTGHIGTFVPALGWYLTILGGGLLTIAGGLRLPSILRRTEPTAALID